MSEHVSEVGKTSRLKRT